MMIAGFVFVAGLVVLLLPFVLLFAVGVVKFRRAVRDVKSALPPPSEVTAAKTLEGYEVKIDLDGSSFLQADFLSPRWREKRRVTA